MVSRCDRCGKDVGKEERRYRSICKTKNGENHRIDMCEKCMFELWGWLKVEKHKRRVSDPTEDDCNGSGRCETAGEIKK